MPEIRISGTRLTTISRAPEREISGRKQKRGPGNHENGDPEVRGPRWGAGRGEKIIIPCPASQWGAGRGFFAGPRKIWGPTCPEANTRAITVTGEPARAGPALAKTSKAFSAQSDNKPQS